MRTVQSSWNAPWLRKLGQVELERLRFDDPSVRRIVDDQMGEIGLPGHRADRGEFRRGKTDEIIRVGLRIRNAVERLGVGRIRNARGLPQMDEGGLEVFSCEPL